MNGFFTDNQTKQKAYDRYYNATAKSDFVQGQKLKALINQQALDDASTESLAGLFQQVMVKSRDYDYDQITKKLLKEPPKPIEGDVTAPSKGKKKPSVANMGDVLEDKPAAPKKASPKKTPRKTKYVPTVTDTDITMATPTKKGSPKKSQ
ncbi:TPA: hypothetical protein N0F65_011597 [Lagenidium giganteum]|uniref:Uncharacterized protein n=1 Tax=Lagenidium giganteum TaxID=4803 RepID=A0AAV2Z759_9STRA|nr:TPA: hypothetical protein N0F65_011597 [Lagenidium giganteum]